MTNTDEDTDYALIYGERCWCGELKSQHWEENDLDNFFGDTRAVDGTCPEFRDAREAI